MCSRTEKSHRKPRQKMQPVPKMQDRQKAAAPVPAPTALHAEKPISEAYAEIDNDLARDNIENDLPDADLQDL